jgi:hypothetical protein
VQNKMVLRTNEENGISMLSPSKDADSLAVIYFLTKDIIVGKTESLELITVYCTYEVFSTLYCEQ